MMRTLKKSYKQPDRDDFIVYFFIIEHEYMSLTIDLLTIWGSLAMQEKLLMESKHQLPKETELSILLEMTIDLLLCRLHDSLVAVRCTLITVCIVASLCDFSASCSSFYVVPSIALKFPFFFVILEILIFQ